MACIVPKCSCNVFKKSSSKNKQTLLQFSVNNCNGCGHYSQLHRKYTSKDTLIIHELNQSQTNSCTGLIPMSKLCTSALFDSFSLIPLVSDRYAASAAFMQSDVACTCSGFHFKDISKILLQFNKLSYDNTTQGLLEVPCDRCTHPLINHQLPSADSNNTSQFAHHDVITEEMEDSTLLVDVVSCDSQVTVCVILKDSDGNWKLFCNSYGINTRRSDNIETGKRFRNSKKRSRENEDGFGNDREMLGRELKAIVNEQHDHLLSLSKISPRYLSCVCSGNDDVTVCVGDHMNGSVFVYCLTKHCQDQVYTVKSHEAVDEGTQLSIILLTTRGSYLCVGTNEGRLKIFAVPFIDKAKARTVNISTKFGFNTTCCCCDDSERYLFVGYESGEIFCYCMSTGSTLYTNRLCSGPVRCLTWIEKARGMAIGSADGYVYMLMISSFNSTDGPINKYFATRPKESSQSDAKFNLTTIYKGHGSFVNCICTHGSSVVTGGWDGLIMVWPYPQSLNRDKEIYPLTEDEPNKIFKIGTQLSTAIIPTAIYSVTSEIILCMYKNMNKDCLILYY